MTTSLPPGIQQRTETIINTIIRLTKVEDVHLLPEIENSAGEKFRELPELAWIADSDDMPAKTHLKYVRKGTSWVAETGNLIVGFVCAESAASDLHIWELSVRQEWQGKGIGRQLMKTVVEYARINKFKSVTLTTFGEVAWNGPFYRSLGFEMIDREKLDARLEKILRQEIQHGLPGALRCAMRLLVAST